MEPRFLALGPMHAFIHKGKSRSRISMPEIEDVVGAHTPNVELRALTDHGEGAARALSRLPSRFQARRIPGRRMSQETLARDRPFCVARM